LDAASFDIVIGRYVLIFQDDVASFLRASARLAKPGGIVAFHEIDDADDFAALPEVPLWKLSYVSPARRSLLYSKSEKTFPLTAFETTVATIGTKSSFSNAGEDLTDTRSADQRGLF
jgi:2-polyprenyl-3-methyl-5-hydroxy-6-metoxy-1,4-benzoquinol methylase